MLQLQGEGDVLQDGALLEEREVLEDHPDALAHVAQLLALEARDVGAVDEHLARGGALEQVDVAHQGGLARTGLADDAEDVAVVDGEAHVVERGEGTFLGLVHLGDVLEFDHCVDPCLG